MTKENRYVLVTTQYRGVYVGELKEHDPITQQCTLINARMCIRWGTDGGVDQLAATGPTAKGKYGALALEAWIPGLTSLIYCTAEAEAAWRAL